MACAEGFVSEEVIVDHHKRKIRLSMLFKWYRDDFGKNDVQVLEFILPFTSGPQRQDIESIVHDMRISKSPYKVASNLRSDTKLKLIHPNVFPLSRYRT